jgi:CDP-diacylglycerol--glycerol-3-phosphate 3-phosphatidyltransferase
MNLLLNMFNLPNFLSLLRLPLAFIFLQQDTSFRALAVILALITDGLDGFIARRYGMVNRIGTLLDPLTDKFFVIFVLIVFIGENRLSPLQACCLISRDFSVLFYGLYLTFTNKLEKARFRAIWSGKITTVLQLIVILSLIFWAGIWPYNFSRSSE